ncbi:MAG: single-stranded DNA-binding protein [Bryobacteraceae bacterium]
MASTRARVSIVGRLGSDPESGRSDNGVDYSRFSVAVGGKNEDAAWFRVTTFNGLSRIASDYLKKGNLVLVEGDLSVESWEDRDGNARTSVKVIAKDLLMLGAGNGNGGSRNGNDQNRQRQSAGSNYRNGRQAGNRGGNGYRNNGSRNSSAPRRDGAVRRGEDHRPDEGYQDGADEYAGQGAPADDIPF